MFEYQSVAYVTEREREFIRHAQQQVNKYNNHTDNRQPDSRLPEKPEAHRCWSPIMALRCRKKINFEQSNYINIKIFYKNTTTQS